MHTRRRPFGRRSRRAVVAGITLIEVLVVISVIALLVALLVPYLRASREEAKGVKCLANLREIVQATNLYMDANEGQHLLPWYQVPPHQGYSPAVVTPWVFGGFRALKPEPVSTGQIDSASPFADSSLYPAQIRPLNRYIDPTAMADAFNLNDRGRDVIKTFICPGDRSNATPLIGSPAEWVEEEPRSSWEANGNSYALNTRWLQGVVGPDFGPAINDPVMNAQLSARIAKHMVGGDASRFILWVEQGFYSATYNATPSEDYADFPPASMQRFGWHRKFSSWSVGFADGHVDHGYFDTRRTFGLGGTIWQPNL